MQIWISLIEAQALPESEWAGSGAYTNGLVLADTAANAEALLANGLTGLGWRLIGAEDTEPFEQRCRECEVDEELKQFAAVAVSTGQPQYGSFHIWSEEATVH